MKDIQRNCQLYCGDAIDDQPANEENRQTPKEKELMNKIEERRDDEGNITKYV